jgi:ClpP class serine protease
MLFFKKPNARVNVIKLSGVIAQSGNKSLNLESVKKLIDKGFIFSSTKNKVLAIVINSPGGSPVQSELIANYVLYKNKTVKAKIIVFVEDVAASGGYWLALMGSEIYSLSSNSIVGSLGVVSAGFGLEDFIQKYGIKRRVYTAGKKKVSLDMFSEEKEEDIARLKDLLAKVHINFKNWVLERRGSKIKLDEEELFSGAFWLATQGLEFGLIDGLANTLEGKLKELYGEKVKINYVFNKQKKGLISSLLGIKSHSNSIADDFLDNAFVKIQEQNYLQKLGL